MQDNAKDELAAIVEMAMEWCKVNNKDYLTLSVSHDMGMADVSVTDCDYEKLSVFMEGDK